jgi:hypothetical protein
MLEQLGNKVGSDKMPHQSTDNPPMKPNCQFFFARLLRFFLILTDDVSVAIFALRLSPAEFDVLTLTTVNWLRPLPAASLSRICASAADQFVDASSMAYL